MKINSIKRTIQNTKRLAEILTVLTRFGFRQVIVDSGLSRILDLKKEEAADIHDGDMPKSVRIRMAHHFLERADRVDRMSRLA